VSVSMRWSFAAFFVVLVSRTPSAAAKRVRYLKWLSLGEKDVNS
jgi:hypothetical protein